MITFKQVGKTYPNGYKAIKNMTFEIQKGELMVFIGPSGCGKTTTMKMINRLSPHTEGAILINNCDIMQEDPVELRRNIGYVIQNAGLFPHYTIEENIALIPSLKGWEAGRKKQRVLEMLELVGLEPEKFASRYPSQLSGGQQQRVGFARALASDPDIVLMDEPFGALDPLIRDQLQNELSRLQKELKKTVIFVTHDLEEAIKLGDRIAIIMDGELVQMDTPEKLLKEPANEFVESFIGVNRLYQNPSLISVTEIMRDNPATALPSLTPAQALTSMRQRRTDTLVLCNEKGRLSGIVSGYDLQTRMGTIKTIGEASVAPDCVLPSTATAQDALIAITNTKFGVIPIVDDREHIIGIITRTSLLTTFADHWAGRRDSL